MNSITKVIERLTLIEERNRLARDLHDTIGHTFVSTIMGLRAVKYQMQTDPAAAEKSIDELLEVTTEGLQEIRRNIHQISDENDSAILSDRLASLAEKFGAYTHTKIFFQKKGLESLYPEAINLTLIRCLQEALTNAKRHGSASKIDIEISFNETEIELRVDDFGKGTPKINEGFGIKAMKERIAALQGSFRISSQAARGTTLHCKIPLPGDA